MASQFPKQIDGGYASLPASSPIVAIETVIGTTNTNDPNSLTYKIRLLQEQTAEDFNFNGGTP